LLKRQEAYQLLFFSQGVCMSNYKHYPSPRNNGDTGTYAKEEGVNCNVNGMTTSLMINVSTLEKGSSNVRGMALL
jgi:hypothetical protein